MMPVTLNNVNHIVCNYRDQITNIMLSRFTIIGYISIGTIFLLDFLTAYYSRLVSEANSFLARLAGENPISTICLSIGCLIFLYLTINLAFIYIKATFLKLRSGKPPFGSLVIAYKFMLQDSCDSNTVFTKTKELFPNKKLIQLYYSGSQAVAEMGVAYGVLLSDCGVYPDDDMIHFLFKNKFRLFCTPAINNAVHIACPIITWLNVPSYYIALRQLYPRLLRFCERHSLCAYPVIEIVHKDEITLFAPLARQDAFVVEEAENLFKDATDDDSFSSHGGNLYRSCSSLSSRSSFSS